MNRSNQFAHGAAAVVVCLAAGGALTFAAQPAVTAAVVVGLAALLVFATRAGLAELCDAIILVAGLWLALAVPVTGLWPLPAAAAIAVTLAVAYRQKRLARWRSWFRRGRVHRGDLVLLAGTIVLTAVALLAWNHLTNGSLPMAYITLAATTPAPLVVIGAFVFLAVNGLVEDTVWFGVLLTALERAPVPRPLGLVTVVVSFGLAHLHGVPDGWIGVAMVIGWGLVLGVLRLRTGGMLQTYLAHVCADATIVAMLAHQILP